MPMTIEKAQVALPSDREVKVTRSFKAPRALVYKAYTDPTLVQRFLASAHREAGLEPVPIARP